jgi:hypothetical protein
MDTQAGVQVRAEAAAGGAQDLRPAERRNTVTLRAILLGLVFCSMAAVFFPYTDNVIRGSWLAEDHTAVGIIALFFGLIFAGNALARLLERRGANPLLRGTIVTVASGAVLYILARLVGGLTDRDAAGVVISSGLVTFLRVLMAFAGYLWTMFAVVTVSRLVEASWAGGRWLSLNRAELLTIFAMMLVATALVTSGLAMQLVPTLSAVGYYQTPANQWPTHVVPNMPEWMRVVDRDAYRGFFEGIYRVPGFVEPEPGRYSEPFLQGGYETWTYLRQIPWHAWGKPLLAWAVFLVPLYTFSICLMVIVRGQWMDREILVYPLTRLPSEMARTEDNPSEREVQPALGPLFRNGAMWLGFALPVVFSMLRAIHAYYLGFPEIKLEWETKLMSDQVTLFIVPSFVAMGFTYLVNTRISFSVWSMSLAGLFFSGWLTLRGYRSPEDLGGYGSSTALMYHLGTGALLTMSVLGLWSARSHLAGVFRKAFLGDPRVDDSREILGFRAAVVLAILSTLVMLGWLIVIGIQWWVALVYWTLAMLIFYGMTRIVAEAGLGSASPPGLAPAFTVSKLGAASMTDTSIVGLGLQYPYAVDVRTFVMAGAANGLKLTHEIEHRRRRLFFALLAAVLVTLVISVVTVIYLSYVYQGTSLELWYYRDAPSHGFNYAKDLLAKADRGAEMGPNTLGWIFSAVGVGLMSLLMVAQRRFLRWPIHPIGLVVVGTSFMTRLWFSVFVAWLVKSIVLKYGGPRLYMRTISFFLGMVMGQCVAAATGCVVDSVTGVIGNSLFTL